MRLQDCCLEIDVVVSAPVQRMDPEEDWVQARDLGVIPAGLFDLYTRARYLSFGSAPPFLSDADNALFSYFGMVLRSVKESLVEADEHLGLFAEAQSQAYDPGKKALGKFWDAAADKKARREFRYLLVALQASLDALADLVALFMPALIPNLRVGRAQFSQIEVWLDRPLPAFGVVVSPQQYFLSQLHVVLRPLVYPGPPERDWLRLMRMFRNKAAHLGDHVFRYMGFHDTHGRFYTFAPRQWPFIWERYMKRPDPSRSVDPNFLPNLFRKTLVHQDVVSYARGLRGKVTDVVAAGISVLNDAYVQFRDFPVNMGALVELQGSSELHEFEYFAATVDAG
jgi:hypothetical protein